MMNNWFYHGISEECPTLREVRNLQGSGVIIVRSPSREDSTHETAHTAIQVQGSTPGSADFDGSLYYLDVAANRYGFRGQDLLTESVDDSDYDSLAEECEMEEGATLDSAEGGHENPGGGAQSGTFDGMFPMEEEEDWYRVLEPSGFGISAADLLGLFQQSAEGQGWMAWELTNSGMHAGNGNIRGQGSRPKKLDSKPKSKPDSSMRASSSSASSKDKLAAGIAEYGSEEALRAAQVVRPGAKGKTVCRFCSNPKQTCFEHIPSADGVEYADTKETSGILRMIKTLTEQYAAVGDEEYVQLRKYLDMQHRTEEVKALAKAVSELNMQMDSFRDTKDKARKLAVDKAVEARVTEIRSSIVTNSELDATFEKARARELALRDARNNALIRINDLQELEKIEEKNSVMRARLMAEGIRDTATLNVQALTLRFEEAIATLKLRSDMQDSFIKAKEWLLSNEAPTSYCRGYAICPTKFAHRSNTDFTGPVYVAVNDWTIANLRPRERADGNGQFLRKILQGPSEVPQHLKFLLRTDPHAYNHAIAHETWEYTPVPFNDAELALISAAMTGDGRATCVAYGDADVSPNFAAFEVKHTSWAPYQCACLCQEKPAGLLTRFTRSLLPDVAGSMDDGASVGFAAELRQKRHQLNCPTLWGTDVVPVVLRVEERREVISLSKVTNCLHGSHIKSTHAATLASMKGAADSDFRVRDVQMLSLLRTTVDSEARLAWLMAHDPAYDISYNVTRLCPEVWSKKHSDLN